jgi:hypothetical protein
VANRFAILSENVGCALKMETVMLYDSRTHMTLELKIQSCNVTAVWRKLKENICERNLNAVKP